MAAEAKIEEAKRVTDQGFCLGQCFEQKHCLVVIRASIGDPKTTRLCLGLVA